MSLEAQINEVLARWDPIGVGRRRGGHPALEYRSYAARIAELLRADVDEDALIAHLGRLTEGMGLSPAPTTRDRIAAHELLELA